MISKSRIDQETYVLINHHRVIADLHEIEPDLNNPKPLELLILAMQRKEVIQTPQELYEKHLVRKPINENKALDLSLNKRSELVPWYNTTLEDPQMFYHYPDINMIISPVPVKSFQVSTKNLDNPKAWSVGHKWAIFSYSESSYHLHKKSLHIKGYFRYFDGLRPCHVLSKLFVKYKF